MPRSLPRIVRLIDIARQAGVSAITVSKVLHNRNGNNTRVSTATAERVREIATRLNYRPNLAARQLAGDRPRLIGGILDASPNETSLRRLIAMEQLISAHGYHLLVGYAHDNLTRIMEHINDFQGRGVDGVACLAHTYPEFGGKILDALQVFPNCVLVEKPVKPVNLPYVTLDFVRAGYLITKHLLSLGRRRIAFLASSRGYQNVREELAGYRQALDEFGVAPIPALDYAQTGNELWELPGLRRALRHFAPTHPDAVIALNDGAAMRVIREYWEHGIRVPDDIAVVSMDSWSAGGSCIPGITAIDLKAPEIGAAVVRMLLGKIAHPRSGTEEENQLLQPQLVIRESCGARLPGGKPDAAPVPSPTSQKGGQNVQTRQARVRM